MRAVLPEIINLDQVAYLKERFIGQNIRVVDDVTTYAYENDQSGIILGSDFEKAFDSVEWSFIYRTMKAFGFDFLRFGFQHSPSAGYFEKPQLANSFSREVFAAFAAFRQMFH